MMHDILLMLLIYCFYFHFITKERKENKTKINRTGIVLLQMSVYLNRLNELQKKAHKVTGLDFKCKCMFVLLIVLELDLRITLHV